MIEKIKILRRNLQKMCLTRRLYLFGKSSEQENKEKAEKTEEKPQEEMERTSVFFFICSNGLSGTCRISCRCGLLQKLQWLAGAA